MSLNFANYYRPFGLPDFSSAEMVDSSFQYNYKALLADNVEGNYTKALDELKQAHNVLGDPEIKQSYDIALQEHLTLVREERDYYAMLNIPAFTTVPDEIEDGRFYEVMRFQPPEDHAEALAFVAEAYAVLTDPQKKEQYDATLRLKRSAS